MRAIYDYTHCYAGRASLIANVCWQEQTSQVARLLAERGEGKGPISASLSVRPPAVFAFTHKVHVISPTSLQHHISHTMFSWTFLEVSLNVHLTFEQFITQTTAKLFVFWMYWMMLSQFSCCTETLWTFIANIRPVAHPGFLQGGAAAGVFGVPPAPSCPLSLRPLRKFRGS